MEFKISKYIAEVLEHYDQVKVKGLGTFVSNKTVAASKPGESFQLNPQLDDDVLVKHINATTEMDLFVATKLVNEEVALMKKVLDSGELVYLGKVGHFYKSHEGRFTFLADKNNADQAKFLHPELELQPMTDAEMAEVKALVKKPKKSKLNFSKRLSTIAPIAVLLLAGVLTWSLISNRSHKRKDNFSKVPIADNRINSSPVSTPVYTPPPVTKKKDIDGVYESPIDTEAATSNPNAKECIIIVGQFRSKDGARRRVSDIYDFGYAAYQDQANGLNRVGIQFTYEDRSEIREMMQNVKKRFDIDSWVLKE